MVDFPFLILDNVDTRSALDAIRELITVTNIYLRERKQPAFILLQDIAAYITRILNIFGAIEKEIEIGFPIGNKQAGQNVSIKLGSTAPVIAYRFEIMFFFTDGSRAITLPYNIIGIQRCYSYKCSNHQSYRNFNRMRQITR